MATKAKSRKKKEKDLRIKVYRHKYAITIYQLKCDGLSDAQVCKMMKMDRKTLWSWKNNHSAVRFAFKEAKKRTRDGGKESTKEYIYGRLDKKHQKLWDRIERIGNNPNSVRRINIMMDKKGGEETRKWLFLHALTESHFSPSEACRKVCVPYKWVKKWVEEDYHFAEMISEIEFHKKKLGETSLMKLVRAGDVAATIFFNRTYNRDLGYGEKTEVEIKGRVDHKHGHTIELSEELMDMLKPDSRRDLVKALGKLELKNERGSGEMVLEEKTGLPIRALPSPKRKEA